MQKFAKSRGLRRALLLPIVVVMFLASHAINSASSSTAPSESDSASRAQRTTTTPLKPQSFLRSLLPTCNRSAIPPPAAVSEEGQFPPDPFTLKQRQQGVVVLHVAGLIYMFVSLAIVCDEFFVPSLDVLTEKLSLSDDVAGATFMAAGGSAPEFFTSVIGVFIAQNNVGIGTIVGSATFNILCVLAFCTLFSNTVLDLTWWPLFRDVSIYMIALAMLVFFFFDEQITWAEALAMFVVYIIYCSVMKYNVELERFVKGDPEETPTLPEAQKIDVQVNHDGQVSVARPALDKDGVRRRSSTTRRQSVPILHSGTMFRNGIMQLMNHTLDQLPEDSEDEESGRRNNTAINTTRPQDTTHLPAPQPVERRSSQIEEIKSLLEEEKEKPLDMTWPDKWPKRLTYVLLAPVVVPMWVTVPDVRRPTSRHLYPATFVISVLWIAFFSYLMVWWANTIGETFVIPTEVIGLTILAAGTSIPDLITSVIVARKGLGDMAVSSSVGSNIFDVCVGLPIPWLLYFLIEFVKSPHKAPNPISVSSKGLLCSVGMLFVMLIVLVSAICLSKWKMNKVFGILMILSYIVFCVFSVALETDVLICPLNIC